MKSWRQNSKSEWRNPKEVRRPNVVVRRSSFGIRYSFVIRHSLFVIACCAALFQAPRSANAQSYSIDSFTIGGGGGASSADRYTLNGTIGQPDAGTLSGGSYALQGGFWPGIVAPSTTGAPTLFILSSGNNVVISWSPTTPGFTLEETESLSLPSWTPAPGGNPTPPITVASGTKFYRLRQAVAGP